MKRSEESIYSDDILRLPSCRALLLAADKKDGRNPVNAFLCLLQSKSCKYFIYMDKHGLVIEALFNFFFR